MPQIWAGFFLTSLLVRTLLIEVFTALATHGGFEQICFRTAQQPPLSSLQQQFGSSPSAARLTFSPLTQLDAAVHAGTLLRGQPYLSELAWERGHRHGHQAYSLVGMIHTLAPPKVRELVVRLWWPRAALGRPDLYLTSSSRVFGNLLNRWQSTWSSVLVKTPTASSAASGAVGCRPGAFARSASDQRSRAFLRAISALQSRSSCFG